MLDKLHPGLSASLQYLPKDVPLTLFTRHSIREEGSGFASYDLPLTDEGRALARAWGQTQHLPIVKAYSSPVQRCIDTASLMIDGHAANDVEVHGFLTEPGCYVQDMMQVGGLFLKLGPQRFISRFLREPLRGMLSAGEGAEKLLQWFRQTQGEAGTITLHVSHDTILAAFIYHLLAKADVDDHAWPWMMEGTYLWFEGDDVNLLWRGEHHRIVRGEM